MDNRELALACWSGLALIGLLSWAAVSQELRRSLADVLRHFFLSSVGGITLALALWTAGLVWLGEQAQLWKPALWSETVLWFLTSAFVLLFKFEQVTNEPDYFGRTARRTLSATLLVEVLVNAFVLPLPLELMLLPVLTFIGVMLAVSETKAEYASVAKLMNGLLVLVGGTMLIYGVVRFFIHLGDVNWALTGRTLALPVWLTFGVLPFIYAVGLHSAYQQLFMRVRFQHEDRKLPRFLRLTAWRKLGLRAHVAGGVKMGWLQRLGEATNRDEVSDILDRYLRWHAIKTRAITLHADYVRTHAGDVGIDSGGRQLDQREFEETKRALRFVADFQQGRQDDDGYWSEVELVLDSFTGLPSEHAIHHWIAPNKRSWFSWRQTPSGWHLGIGQADGDDETIWLYDGPRQPTGPPGARGTWGTRFSPASVNW